MKTGIVVQARMGSTRLPGKVLMPLPEGGDRRTLDWVIGSCLETGYPVFVATSTNPEDDAIEEHVRTEYAPELGWNVTLFRGHPTDVLDRIWQCAHEHGLDEIVRITGDCPFIDPEVILQVIALRREHGADYASNVDPPTWPDGLDVQVVTMAALTEAHRHATDPTDRDTVLQWIVRRRKEFAVVNLPCPFPGMEGHRWVLDTTDDYRVCRGLAAWLMSDCKYHPRMADMLVAARGMFDITDDPTSNPRNERYLAARAAELTADDFGAATSDSLKAREVQPYGASTYSKSHVAWGDHAPLVMTHAAGSRVFDTDGNEFIDFTGALGTTILGHADPELRDAITRHLDLGIAFPMAHDIERDVAKRLVDLILPGGMVVFGKNGSDVTSAAVRLARVVTGRQIIARHRHGYHGWHDWALSGTERLNGWDVSPIYMVNDDGIMPDGIIEHCAALIVEPDRFAPEALKAAMDKCREFEVAVIFDEMVTAFRYPRITYAAWHGLQPDLICLGKALGNGMPVTALVGHAAIMRRFVTEKDVSTYAFYSGTHFGETLSLAAARHVLERMDHVNQVRLYGIALRIHDIVTAEITAAGLDAVIKVGPPPLSRLTFPDPGWANTFRRTMMRNGCLVYSAFFAMLAHSDADLERLRFALNEAMQALMRHEAHEMPPATGIMRT